LRDRSGWRADAGSAVIDLGTTSAATGGDAATFARVDGSGSAGGFIGAA
jgi:hypothetical protein